MSRLFIRRISDSGIIAAVIAVCMIAASIFAVSDIALADDYTPVPQGKDNTVTILSPTGISFSETDDYYYDKVLQPITGNTVTFGFTMSAGTNNFKEDQFKSTNMPKINVYDSYPGGKIIASYNSGKAAYISYDGFEDSEKRINISVHGLPDGTYSLVFGSDVCGNSPDRNIGIPIVVEFQVEGSTNPPLEDGGDVTGDCTVSDFNGLQTAINGLATDSEVPTVIKINGNIEIEQQLTVADGARVEIRSADSSNISCLKRETTDNMFYVRSGGELNLADITLDGNSEKYATAGSLVYVSGNLNVCSGTVLTSNSTGTSGKGGAIYANGGKVDISGGEISHNSAQFGAGVYAAGKAQLVMAGGSVEENTAMNGCGIFVTGSGTEFNMNGGKVTGNIAEDIKGGGVYIVRDGKFVMNGGTISNNSVEETNSGGGGVYADNGGVFVMKGGLITGNHANDGAGVYVLQENSSFIMEGGIIRKNEAATGGGGVYTSVQGIFTMDGGLITENEAQAGGGIGIGSGVITINAGTVSNNKADWGAGIYLVSGNVEMNGGAVSGNKAVINDAGNGGMGGGVYTTGLYNCFTFNGGEIEGNTAERNGGGIYFTMSVNTVILNGGEIYGNTAAKGSWIYIEGGSNKLVVLKNTLIPENEELYNEGSLVIDGGIVLTNEGSITQLGQIGGNKVPLTQGNSGEYGNWVDPECNGIVNGLINGEMKYFIADMSISVPGSAVYTGNSIEPDVVIKNGETTLAEGRDYDLSYTDNVYPGTGKITVTGLNDYSGTVVLKFNITPPDLKSPASAKASLYKYDCVKISWSKVTGASGYCVYYKTSGLNNYKYLGSTAALSYKTSGLADGVKYSFKVYPYVTVNGKNYMDSDGKICSDLYTLKKVTGTSVKKSSSKYVKVSWENISGESGYQIARSAKKSKGFKVVKTVGSKYKSCKIKTTRNKRYYYKVRAYKTVNGQKIYAPWSSVKAYKLK